MGVLLLTMTIGGLIVAAILLVIAIATRKTWLRNFVFGGVAVWFAFYVVMLIGFSLSSEEKVLGLNEPKQFCGFYLDCHLHAAVTGVQARGKAELQDKTMVDALAPARDAYAAALGEGATFGDALRRSADAAEEGMKGTIPLVARKGRASYLGERSAGHQDPGATSSWLLVKTVADTWGGD